MPSDHRAVLTYQWGLGGRQRVCPAQPQVKDASEQWKQGWQLIILVLLDLIKDLDICSRNTETPKEDFNTGFVFSKYGRK